MQLILDQAFKENRWYRSNIDDLYPGFEIEKDDGKRALSVIGVAEKGASPLKGVWGKQVRKVRISRDDGKRALSAIEVA